MVNNKFSFNLFRFNYLSMITNFNFTYRIFKYKGNALYIYYTYEIFNVGLYIVIYMDILIYLYNFLCNAEYFIAIKSSTM